MLANNKHRGTRVMVDRNDFDSEFVTEAAFSHSQIYTMIALVMLGLGLFTLVVRAGMQETSTAQYCDRIIDAADRTSCFKALKSEVPLRPAKGALAPDPNPDGDRR